jgi:hypothetical protein
MGGRENSSFLEINQARIRGRQRTQKTNTTPVLPFSCLVFQRTVPQWIRQSQTSRAAAQQVSRIARIDGPSCPRSCAR